MKKVFYTARDIEDMARRGEMQLPITDNVVVTDHARERARDLGVELVRPGQATRTNAPANPAPRPASPPSAPAASTASPAASISDAELVRRVKAAVIARVGKGVDEALLDRIIPTIIRRVREGG